MDLPDSIEISFTPYTKKRKKRVLFHNLITHTKHFDVTNYNLCRYIFKSQNIKIEKESINIDLNPEVIAYQNYSGSSRSIVCFQNLLQSMCNVLGFIIKLLLILIFFFSISLWCAPLYTDIPHRAADSTIIYHHVFRTVAQKHVVFLSAKYTINGRFLFRLKKYLVGARLFKSVLGTQSGILVIFASIWKYWWLRFSLNKSVLINNSCFILTLLLASFDEEKKNIP